MAISIDSTTNLNLIDAAESLTGWSFSGITKTALNTGSREGTNCVAGQIPNNSYGYAWHTHGSSVDVTAAGNERVYIWVNTVGPGTLAQNGWQVLIGDGTNRRSYTVGGSDDEPFSVKGWKCLMLDTANLPATYQQVAGGAVTLTAVTQFGAGLYNTIAPSGNAVNVFFDVVRYGSGIIVTSGATDNISLSDVAAEDFSSATGKAYGIIKEIQPGVYGVQGDIIWGDTAGGSIDWKETDAVVIFEDRVKGTGTNTNFCMNGVHSATGTFRAELGVVVSSGDSESGRSGVIFVSANAANQPVDFDFSDSDIEDVFLYGCTFTNCRGIIAFSNDATNGISHHISGTTFSGCSQVDAGRVVIRNSVLAATGDVDSALLWNENINIKRTQFLGNTVGAAIEHPSAAGTPYTYYDLTFAGNTFDGLNTSGSNIDVNLDGTSDAALDEGANTITYIGSVSLIIEVLDEANDPIQNVQSSIYLLNSPFTELMNEDTLASGIASESYTGTTPVDVKWRARKSETTDDPRYYPKSGTGTITAANGFSTTTALKVNTSIPSGVAGVYTGVNAADPENEVNGTANTVDNHFGNAVWSSGTSPTPHDGSYVLLLTHGTPDNAQVVGFLTAKGVLNGQNVTINLYVQEVVGSNWRLRLNADDGWTVSSSAANPVGGASWELISLTGTADQDDPELEIYTTTSGDQNDQIAIDNVVITVN